MAAYIVAQLDVKNTNWQKAYGPKAGAWAQQYGGKVRAEAGSTLERLEGKSLYTMAGYGEARAAHALDAVSGSEEAQRLG